MLKKRKSRDELDQGIQPDTASQTETAGLNERVSAVLEVLEESVWSKLPEDVRGKRIEKAEFDAIFE